MAAPNQTLYISNLNDKLRKPDLRLSLYTLFSTYGVVLDVVALKTMKHRGQAFVAFRDVASATQAMRAMDGVNIFGKEMKIKYARTKSNKIAKLDGTYKMPNSAAAAAAESAEIKPFVALPGAVASPPATASTGPPSAPAAPAAEAAVGQKRLREEEEDEDESEVEMDMADDDD
ncbi:hypothetical protein BZA77DRAFT_69315 [Pyronema omphalodes]|nr:hypothetical protein BZA77DRAFT_69315 [Pyronema omphalodes]